MRLLVLLLNLAWAVLLVAPSASAQPYAPPAGKVLTGVTNREGAAGFDRQVGHRSAVFQSFVAYGYTGAEWAFSRAAAAPRRFARRSATCSGSTPRCSAVSAASRTRSA